MIGFLLTLVIFAFTLIFNSLPEAISSAGNFLYIWSWIFAIIKTLFLSLIALGVTSFLGLGGAGIASEGSSSRGAMILGGLLGAGAGGAVSGLIFVRALIKNALMIIGAYLITISGTGNMTFDQFDKIKLLAGLIIVIITLLVFRKKRSR